MRYQQAFLIMILIGSALILTAQEITLESIDDDENDERVSVSTPKEELIKRQGKLRAMCPDNTCEILEYIYKDLYQIQASNAYIGIDTFGNRVLFDESGNILERHPSKQFRNWDHRFFYTTTEGKAGVYDLLHRSLLIPAQQQFVNMTLADKHRFVYSKLETDSNPSTILMIDTQGKVLIEEGIFHSFQPVSSADLLLVFEEETASVMDLDGKMIIDGKDYEEVKTFNDLIILKQAGKYGVLHPSAQVLFPCIIDEFTASPRSPDVLFVRIEGEQKKIVFSKEEGKYITVNP